MVESGGDRDWHEYRKLVLAELDRLNINIASLGVRIDRNYTDYQSDIGKVRIDIAMLQVKAGLWGAAAGILITMGAVFIKYIGGH